MELLCVGFVFPTRVFVIDYLCSVWWRGLSTCALYFGQILANLFFISRFVSSIQWRIYFSLSCKYILIVTIDSMELLVSAKLAHPKFHGIPWNCSCQRNWRIPSSTEFHGTAKLAHFKFHGIPWNCLCQRNWRTPISMEVHGIPWNYSCQRNWRTRSSMEFHGIPWNHSCHRNWRTPSSMEFHRTAGVSEIGALLVP